MEINIGQPRTEDSCVVYETVKVKLKKQTFITHHGSSRKHPVFWGVLHHSMSIKDLAMKGGNYMKSVLA